jgi:hypothetical protein
MARFAEDLGRANRSVDKAVTAVKSPTLAEVCQSPGAFLDALDIGALNLMCAGGLPGAEELELGRLLTWMDEAAEKVDLETRRHWYRFLDSPGTFNNSPGYFCCYFLLQVLQEDLGVKYNPARVRDPSFQDPKCLDPDFRDSRDLFIHGIIDGPGGTCASMPVLYVAVGRRLGYPLKLVECRAHLFFRWDDPTGQRLGIAERFNVDGSGHGIGSYPDEHYRTWPEPWSAAEEAGGWYLKSLSPLEELAAFLSTRGECLADNGRNAEAIQAYQWACGLMPDDLRYGSRLVKLVRRSQQAALDLQEMLAMQRSARDGARSPAWPSGNKQVPVVPPHGGSCQCLHCRQAREAAQPKPHPMHPVGCPCFQCRQAREAASQERPFGHPQGCACYRCRTAAAANQSASDPFAHW